MPPLNATQLRHIRLLIGLADAVALLIVVGWWWLR